MSENAERMSIESLLKRLDAKDATIDHITEQRDALRDELKIMEHKVITCGVAAWHSDANLTRTGAYTEKWDSPQAEAVRKLREQRDALLAACEGLVTRCPCRGTGRFMTACSLCGDSTFEHICEERVVECNDKQCIAARAAIAKAGGGNG